MRVESVHRCRYNSLGILGHLSHLGKTVTDDVHGYGQSPLVPLSWRTPRYVVRSETNGRENNEDSYQILGLMPAPTQGPLWLLAVADGMGGYLHGEEVSREALQRMTSTLFGELVSTPSINSAAPALRYDMLHRALTIAVSQANSRVRRMVEANGWGRAGSTLVAALVADDAAVVVNIGDSPLYHFDRARGFLTQVTPDHTQAASLVRAGLIPNDVARFHEGRSRLNYYIGAAELPDPLPISDIRLGDGDLLLLCSDGISGALEPPEIEQILRADSSLSVATYELLSAAVAAGETDNQTIILWRHGDSDDDATRETAKTEVITDPGRESAMTIMDSTPSRGLRDHLQAATRLLKLPFREASE